MQFLSYDLRMAGYFGCSNEINNATISALTADEGGSSGDTDGVTIFFGEPHDAGEEIFLTTGYDPYGDDPETLVLNDVPDDWSDGNTLIISDCGSAASATIDTGGIDSEANTVTLTSSDFGRVFDPSTGNGGLITVRRLLANSYDVQTGTSGIPVLRRNTLELVEGVENLQLLYRSLAGGGFSDGGSGVPATLAGVQLAALVRSVSNENLTDREYGSGADITEDDGAHTLLNQDISGVTGTIRGQRRVFSTTLQVRNRPR
jgi:Tfp pilus assembly protein PilW